LCPIAHDGIASSRRLQMSAPPPMGSPISLPASARRLTHRSPVVVNSSSSVASVAPRGTCQRAGSLLPTRVPPLCGSASSVTSNSATSVRDHQ